MAALPAADLDWGAEAPKFWYAGGKGARVQRHELLGARKADLAARVDGLGMANAARDFAETGVCIVEDAIPLVRHCSCVVSCVYRVCIVCEFCSSSGLDRSFVRR